MKVSQWYSLLGVTLASAWALALAGCQTPPPATPAPEDTHADLTLREGDVVKITFPGAADLTPPEPLQIRRDGKITLPIAGEVQAAGRTPAQLQEDLLALFSKQLVSKEVVVTVISSTFVVFVDGDVIHPGKIVSDHPITLLEAIMEAGGFDYTKADTGRVMVIRHSPGQGDYHNYTVDLKQVLEGRSGDVFHLAPGDVVHVADKFSWF